MDALELLKRDHQHVARLFKEVEETDDSKKHWQLFEQISAKLEAHAYSEETVLYPAFKKHEELKDLTLEAVEEHKQIKTLISEINALTENSERFAAKLKVMGENVEHHVKEEENEMFPKARKLFNRPQLEQLGQALEEAKKKYGKAPQKNSNAG